MVRRTTKNYFFALGYIPHRLWGSVLIAQVLEKDEADMYYVTGEVLLKSEHSLSYQKLTPIQKEVVNLIDEYNDKMLHRLFSKKKTVKDFMDSVDEETKKVHIRPYIEHRLYAIFEIALQNNFHVFLKEKATQNIFNDDFLTLERGFAKPMFHFHRNEENTSYKLSILHNQKSVELINERAEVICNSPALVLLEKKVFFVDELEGRKLTPFFTKEHVTIQRASEEKYYASFLANTLKEHDVIDGKGFEIVEIDSTKKASLTLEMGMNKQPVWLLRLFYNNYCIYPAAVQKRFVDLKKEDSSFIFERFLRDEEWEEQLEVTLEEIGLKSRDKNGYSLRSWSNNTPQSKVYEAVKFTNEHSEYFKEHDIRIDQKLDVKYFLEKVEMLIESSEKEDWFDLLAKVQFGEFSLPFIKLRNHILNGDRLYELPDGTFAVIPEEWFSKYKSLFQFGSLEGEHLRIHKQHFSQVDDALKRKHSTTMANLEKLNLKGALPEVPIPIGLKAEMRDYQKEGFEWMWFLQGNGFGGCLADDMGLGKTLQAIALLQFYKERYVESTNEDTPDEGQLSIFQTNGQTPTALVIVPSSLIQNWVNEMFRFAPSLKVLPHVGVSRRRDCSKFKYYDVIVSTYHTVRQDIEFLRDYAFNYVILDESQMIKNPQSKLYRAIIQLQAAHRLVLTGTPIENSLTDLWSQINFVNEGLLGSLNFFKKQFVKTIEKKQNKEQEQRLKELINPFILRRTKEEVAKELPPLYEQYRFCNMTDEQKSLYEEEKSTVRNSLLENLEEIGFEKSTMLVLKALTRLRQLSNHPLMVEEDYEYGSGKYDEVFRNMESVVSENHKVLVFSSFVKHLDLYGRKLDELGWKYARLTGSTKDRAGEVDKFQEDPDFKIFLISLKAGGVGLNLTAADYVFILDPWWNPAAEMQALNRAHRIGQDKSVFVYRFISNHTVEEKIQHLQQRKSELAKTFVSSNNPLRNMKKEDVLELFS